MQFPEVRSQKSEVRGQKSEDRRQKTEVREEISEPEFSRKGAKALRSGKQIGAGVRARNRITIDDSSPSTSLRASSDDRSRDGSATVQRFLFPEHHAKYDIRLQRTMMASKKKRRIRVALIKAEFSWGEEGMTAVIAGEFLLLRPDGTPELCEGEQTTSYSFKNHPTGE